MKTSVISHAQTSSDSVGTRTGRHAARAGSAAAKTHAFDCVSTKTNISDNDTKNALYSLRTRLHHPDISFPVIRRRVTVELLDLICACAKFFATRGRSLLRPTFTPSGTATNLAAHRLAKAGLITYRRSRGCPPELAVTSKGADRASTLLWPERFWTRRWDGRWYLLMYDVPEKERAYRCALERFFRKVRMGNIQKSIWISAWDIRPLFDDLAQAAAIRDYAILFEATTVLGQSTQQIAAQAWKFKQLEAQQNRYIKACEQRTTRSVSQLKPSAIFDIAREELSEYLHLMESDPLLPMELLPPDYAGRRVVAAFRGRMQSLAKSLFTL